DHLPSIYNPPRDYVVTANQAVVPLAYYAQLAAELGANANNPFSYYWSYGERGERITDLLLELTPNSVETYQRIQGDNKSLNAELIAPYLADLTIDDPLLADARDYLLDWDYQMHMDSGPAALFGMFNMHLLTNLFDDQLPGGIQADNHELW